MHGVDGNYLKMQGEMMARIQVAQQSDQVAQQVRAQAQSQEALRQLREQVGTMSRPDSQSKSLTVDPGKDGRSDPHKSKGSRPRGYLATGEVGMEEDPAMGNLHRGHVDLRI